QRTLKSSPWFVQFMSRPWMSRRKNSSGGSPGMRNGPLGSACPVNGLYVAPARVEAVTVRAERSKRTKVGGRPGGGGISYFTPTMVRGGGGTGGGAAPGWTKVGVNGPPG